MTNTAVVGGYVTGNIGSCSVISTDINVSSFYKQTIAVNSCTGEVISNSGVYFDYTIAPLVVIPLVLLFVMAFVLKDLFSFNFWLRN